MDPLVLRNLGRVATALREAGIDDFVFVGGAAVGLLLTDTASQARAAEVLRRMGAVAEFAT